MVRFHFQRFTHELTTFKDAEYVLGYSFDLHKIQTTLGKEAAASQVHLLVELIMDNIDRDVNPLCLGLPTNKDTTHTVLPSHEPESGDVMRVVVTLGRGTDVESLKSRLEGLTIPDYLQYYAHYFFSGPAVFRKVD